MDYDNRQGNDKVLVQVGDHYFQYNKAKGYNAGTNDMRDQLVVVQKRSDEKTLLRAGLDSNTGAYMGGSLQIRVCRAYQRANGVDVMEVSVGARSTNCGTRTAGATTNSNNNNGGSWSNRASTYGSSTNNNNNAVSYVRSSIRVVNGGTSSNNNNRWQTSWRATNSRSTTTTTTTNRNNNVPRWSSNPGGTMSNAEEKPEDTEPKRHSWQFFDW